MLPIPPRVPETVPLLDASPFASFTRAWRPRPGEDVLAIIVKGTFELTPDGPARVAAEQELPSGEEPFEDAGSDLVRYPGDLAYLKPRADVILTGFAYPRRRGEVVTRVGLTLGDRLDYALAAIGDRIWERGGPSAPQPFERIPLRPERAFGGPGYDANPFGVGHAASVGDRLPNLERPDRLITSRSSSPAPAMTTPIGMSWPSRRRLTGTYDRAWLRARWPYFPEDFDPAWFNVAPRDLQVPYLAGDERYSLAGVRPDGEVLRGQLPCLAARAFVQPRADAGVLREVPLRLDTLFLDAEAGRCVLVWRGGVRVADPEASDLASVFVHAEPMDAPMTEAERTQAFVERVNAGADDGPEWSTDERSRDDEEPGMPVELDRGPLPVPLSRPAALATSRAWIEARLVRGEPLAGADLAGSDLSGLDLSGRDLSGAILTGADLRGAALRGTVLRGATLSESKAEGVSFAGADLVGADLSRAALAGASFEGANLSDASLDEVEAADASFLRAQLSRATLTDATLERACFDDADLSEADLSGAYADAASFARAILIDARLYGASLAGARADDADATGMRADDAGMQAASLRRLKASGASLRRVDLTDADLRESVLAAAVLADVILERARLDGADLREARLVRARMRSAQAARACFMEAVLEAADLEHADLSGANLYGAETYRARMANAELGDALTEAS